MRRLTRTATNGRSFGKPVMNLGNFLSPTGVYYSYDVRALGRRLMFSITFLSGYDEASLYDGEDFEDSFEAFCELGLAIMGLDYAENFARTKAKLERDLGQLADPGQDQTLKRRPLFLGDADFPVC